ncbi:MAG: SDR family NAD(P)-dependent oxidoreductase, partial [Sphingobacteriales bacterium]
MRISILGCGWLGMPLAKKLAGKGNQVKGSVTSEIKVNELTGAGVTPYILSWESGSFKGNLDSFLKTDTLI